MKYINLFEEFLFEEVKHINNDVIYYKNKLINIIEENIKKNKLIFFINLDNRNDFKLNNLRVELIINPSVFSNYGQFKKTSTTKFENLYLSNCSLILEVQLSEEELSNSKISIKNKIHSLLNHELNHALETYQYEFKSKRYRISWDISKKYQEHRKFADNFKYWSDFIYMIYLGLDHEMSSRISSIYEDIKTYENIDFEIQDNKIYKDAMFMSKFNFDSFYNLLIKQYSESTFIDICERFCNDFDYKFISDIEYCKNMIKRIIKSLNKKGVKILNKIKNVIKRVKMERINPSFNNEGFIDKNIDYKDYEI
jgi:hypothetical protein